MEFTNNKYQISQFENSINMSRCFLKTKNKNSLQTEANNHFISKQAKLKKRCNSLPIWQTLQKYTRNLERLRRHCLMAFASRRGLTNKSKAERKARRQQSILRGSIRLKGLLRGLLQWDGWHQQGYRKQYTMTNTQRTPSFCTSELRCSPLPHSNASLSNGTSDSSPELLTSNMQKLWEVGKVSSQLTSVLGTLPGYREQKM